MRLGKEGEREREYEEEWKREILKRGHDDRERLGFGGWGLGVGTDFMERDCTHSERNRGDRDPGRGLHAAAAMAPRPLAHQQADGSSDADPGRRVVCARSLSLFERRRPACLGLNKLLIPGRLSY